MSILLVPGYQALDDDGNPISGAKLYSYIAGTTTPLALYTDEALTAEATNPVISNANGRFAPLYRTGDAYKFTFTDADENVIETFDNVTEGGVFTKAISLTTGQIITRPGLYEVPAGTTVTLSGTLGDSAAIEIASTDLSQVTLNTENGYTLSESLTVTNGVARLIKDDANTQYKVFQTSKSGAKGDPGPAGDLADRGKTIVCSSETYDSGTNIYSASVVDVTQAQIEAGTESRILVFNAPTANVSDNPRITVGGTARSIRYPETNGTVAAGDIQSGRVYLDWDGTNVYLLWPRVPTGEIPQVSGVFDLATSTYIGTAPGLRRVTIEDGSPRLFEFVPNVDNIGNASGQTFMKLNDDTGSANIFQTLDGLAMPSGYFVGGQPELIYSKSNKYFILKTLDQASNPKAAAVKEIIETATTSQKAKEVSHAHMEGLGPLVETDLQSYVLNDTWPLYVTRRHDLQGTIRVNVSGAFLDLSLMGTGQVVEIDCQNESNNASARLYLPSGATWVGNDAGAFAGEILALANGDQVSIKRNSENVYRIRFENGTPTIAGDQNNVVRDVTFGFIGQSLARRFFFGSGLTFMQEALDAYGLSGSVHAVNAAEGSSSLFKANAPPSQPTFYWWDENTNSAGPLTLAAVTAFQAAVTAGQPAPGAVFFNIGQNDADNIADSGVTTITTVADHYVKVINHIRANVTGMTNTPFFIQFLGADDGGAYTNAQCGMFRRAQLKAIEDGTNVYDCGSTIGCAQKWDDVHITLNYDGMGVQAGRMIDAYYRHVVLNDVYYLEDSDSGEAAARGLTFLATASFPPSNVTANDVIIIGENVTLPAAVDGRTVMSKTMILTADSTHTTGDAGQWSIWAGSGVHITNVVTSVGGNDARVNVTVNFRVNGSVNRPDYNNVPDLFKVFENAAATTSQAPIEVTKLRYSSGQPSGQLVMELTLAKAAPNAKVVPIWGKAEEWNRLRYLYENNRDREHIKLYDTRAVS